MKWLGAALTVICGVGIGWMNYLRLQRRQKTLHRCICAIRRLGDRIRYAATPLETILCELSDSEEFRGFALLPQPEKDADLREAWATLVRERGGEQGLSADDITVMAAFVTEIGKSDVTGQLKFCEEYGEILENHRLAAQRDLENKGRLYMTLGICGGVTAALLLW